MLDESNNVIQNSTTLGPLREGHRFTTTCEVRGTRPAPTVGWYRAGKILPGNVYFFLFKYISYACRIYHNIVKHRIT